MLQPLIANATILTVNGTLIVELIAFIIMVGILAKWVYPPVMARAQERQDQIQKGIDAASEAERRLAAVTKEVEALLDDARSQARDVISRSREEAKEVAADLRAQAESQSAAAVSSAREDIAAERDRALAELRDQFGNLVVEAAGKVLERSIDLEGHKDLIDGVLNGVGPASER